MTKTQCAAVLLFAIGILFPVQKLLSCSSYKITAHGKTMVGSNYDSWFTNPVIWFETNGYGASFSGARREGENSVAPQTGLNVHGLSFVTLAAPPQTINPAQQGKKPIASRSNYLKDILHTCRNVEEVKAYVEQHDRSLLFDEVFLYTDSSGHYLVVEPNALTIGEDPSYVLANFCPSTIADISTIKQERYINGSAFVSNKIDSSLAFCTALSDTMHVCRDKIGDGTLLTSILDLKRGIIHLYFYHDYQHHAQLSLQDELAKGEHQIEIATLFPVNAEYEAFLAFKTPGTSTFVTNFLFSCAGFFFLSGFIFLVSFFRNRGEKYRYVKLLLPQLFWILTFYTLVLIKNDGIYYFPAPYQDYQFSILDVAAYVPFVLLIAAIPLIVVNRNLFRSPLWGRFMRGLFTVTNVAFVLLIIGFGYWGLYNVF